MNIQSGSINTGNKLANNIQQPSSFTLPGNPDILFPPQSGNAVPFSRNGVIDGWTTMPEGNSIVVVINGQIDFIPINGRGVLTSDGNNISIIEAQESGLSLFNNSLGWTETKECT